MIDTRLIEHQCRTWDLTCGPYPVGRYPDSLYLTLGRVHYLDGFPRRQHFLKHRVFSRGKFSGPPPALRHAHIHTVTTLSLTLTWTRRQARGAPQAVQRTLGAAVCSVFRSPAFTGCCGTRPPKIPAVSLPCTHHPSSVSPTRSAACAFRGPEAVCQSALKAASRAGLKEGYPLASPPPPQCSRHHTPSPGDNLSFRGK